MNCIQPTAPSARKLQDMKNQRIKYMFECKNYL